MVAGTAVVVKSWVAGFIAPSQVWVTMDRPETQTCMARARPATGCEPISVVPAYRSMKVSGGRGDAVASPVALASHHIRKGDVNGLNVTIDADPASGPFLGLEDGLPVVP